MIKTKHLLHCSSPSGYGSAEECLTQTPARFFFEAFADKHHHPRLWEPLLFFPFSSVDCTGDGRNGVKAESLFHNSYCLRLVKTLSI
jgi:hypothetical protein